ncbi:hypothetical protein [Streptomyces hygroscopicus]|uniref:hypothetical protein n=1 Tax=Streptomyces hygroscopicus TaxID=1912 RepID=UPI00131DD5F7|nr:hypothetical protein [Streptomyces hygroscopicus]
MSTSWLADARAIASGKRRSSPAAYRAAQAALAPTPTPEDVPPEIGARDGDTA